MPFRSGTLVSWRPRGRMGPRFSAGSSSDATALAAAGGALASLLVGLDIIEGLFDSGFVLSRAAAEARAAAAAQQVAMGA